MNIKIIIIKNIFIKYIVTLQHLRYIVKGLIYKTKRHLKPVSGPDGAVGL